MYTRQGAGRWPGVGGEVAPVERVYDVGGRVDAEGWLGRVVGVLVLRVADEVVVGEVFEGAKEGVEAVLGNPVQ